jgi:hypothetical protein
MVANRWPQHLTAWLAPVQLPPVLQQPVVLRVLSTKWSSCGCDVLLQWQAQPLGPPAGRHPTVGAKSMPGFLVSQAGGEAPRCQVGQGLTAMRTHGAAHIHTCTRCIRRDL